MNRQSAIAAFVDDVDRTPFQVHYRGKPHLAPVVGWRARLHGYFWPRPECGYAFNVEALKLLLVTAEKIARAPTPWAPSLGDEACRFACRVFAWGGVRQKKPVTPARVAAVVHTALGGTPDDAPMNSGWTKVAALVTSHLEDRNLSQAIYDSRVAWSLIRRFDRILTHAGFDAVPEWLPYIGRIRGQGGGTRSNMETRLWWPPAYQSWKAHFAASALIRDIRDELNRRPVAGFDGKALWTVRTVEMVLFMDGY